MISLDTTVKMKPSKCCECDHEMDHASGPCQPSANDWTLCIKCGSLNIFTGDLGLRAPTFDEMIASAKDSELQRLRRLILEVAEAAE